jgi:hypothetical protein
MEKFQKYYFFEIRRVIVAGVHYEIGYELISLKYT